MTQGQSHNPFITSAMGAILVVVFALGACESQSVHSRVIATVGSQNITVTDLALRLLQTPGLKEASPEAKLKSAQIILDSLMDDSVLFLEAKNRGFTTPHADIEHHFRHQKALLGKGGLFRFQRESLIDDANIKAQYQVQLTVTAFLKSLHDNGQAICEILGDTQGSQNCTKKEDLLLELRKKYRIHVNDSNIPLALKVFGEHA